MSRIVNVPAESVYVSVHMFLIFQLFNFVLGSFNFSNLDQLDLDQLTS